MLVYEEDELLPISALQHMAFCERQAALIHVEGQWQENVLTVEGHQLHERVHEADNESKGDMRIARSLRLCSTRLGLTGMADVVEFHRIDASAGGEAIETSATLPGVIGRWKPYIVEYKHGAPKIDHIDEVQLCAQAICLEEMLGVRIEQSAFFYGRPRRRHEVHLDSEVRNETVQLAQALHDMVDKRIVPPPSYAERCERCSLVNVCLPKLPLALSLINLKQIKSEGFQKTESGAVVMDETTRKTLLVEYQKRKQEEIIHPFLNERVAIGLLPHVQAMLLSRYWRGELESYPPFISK